MFAFSLTAPLPKLSTPVLPGTWKLGAGQALALHPRTDAQLRVATGGLWVTLGQAPRGRGNESGDIFLRQGDVLTVCAGHCVVIETWGGVALSPSYFSWDALACDAQPPLRTLDRWQLGVVQPLRDMGEGFALVVSALARLAAGLVRALWPARRLAECAQGPALQ